MTDLDAPAIGRKLARLFATDRPAALSILTGTHEVYWPALARAYLLALGISDPSCNAIVPGVLYVWGQLVKESTPLCTSTSHQTKPTD